MQMTIFKTHEQAEKLAATIRKDDPDWSYETVDIADDETPRFVIIAKDESGEFVGTL